ncbi:hypothetical protein [Ulvibacterium marinum]|nr:hypothetical protein [Ulvibacterium marinum]
MGNIFKILFKLICYVALIVPVYHITIYMIDYGPFYTALWLLACLVVGGFLKPLVDRLANRLFG